MNTNMKPADELLTLRSRIKELQAREKELTEGIKAGEIDPQGDFAVAFITKRATRRFDRKAAEAEVGDPSKFDVVGETKALRIEELTNPDAA